jgi:DNA-binding NtrC family response regulator
VNQTHQNEIYLLLVDDHATNRLVASATIKRALPNARIDEARNGTEAIEKMKVNCYDLVLMDLIMPDYSGIEVTRIIRTECAPPLCDVPVVALTANMADDAVKGCLEVGIRELLSEILADEGHTVWLAENATAARKMRSEKRPDLVLLDIWMPDTDGISLLKEWSAGGLLNMPVVMMSGHATIDTAVEATRIGAVNFLEKPIALQKLLKTVEQALEKAPPKELFQPDTKSELNTAIGSKSEDLKPAETQAEASTFNFSYIDLPLREARDLFEKSYFEYHLEQAGGSMTKVSEKTGLERTHLYRKLKALGIDVGSYKGD